MRCAAAEQVTGIFEIVEARGSGVTPVVGRTWQIPSAVRKLGRPHVCASPPLPPPGIDAGQHARRFSSLVFDA